MNKLTILHLAKRLPYGVKFISNGEIFLITEINTIDPFPIWATTRENKKTLLREPEINVRPDVLGRGFRLPSIKPILFPLSALTQEITVNGETFVPIVELLKIKHPQEGESEKYLQIECSKDGYPRAWYKYRANFSIMIYPFQLYELSKWIHDKFLEWHLDTDGLIESGLAISVFDLPENPYK